MSTMRPPITRSYRGNPSDAAKAMQKDAEKLARDGYYPASQTYTPGSWGCGAFLIALLLFFVCIGLLVFIYMLLVKPDGTLIVVYQYQPPQPTHFAAAQPVYAPPPQPRHASASSVYAPPQPDDPVAPPPGASATPQLPDAAAAMKALADMRDAGHISQEEYDAKKAELLARM